MAADAAMSPVGEQQSGMGCLGSCHPQVPVQWQSAHSGTY